MTRTFRSWPGRLTVTLATAFVLAACGTAAGGGAPGSVATSGSTAASAGGAGLSFHGSTLNGARFDASSLRGRPVALWFWAPWCTICRAEAPTVAKVAAAFDGRVTVVGVAGQGTVEQMKAFVQQTGTNGIVHLGDVRGAIWREYQVVSQPSFVFVRADGQSDLFVGSLDEGTLTTLMTATAHGSSASSTGTATTDRSGSLACNSDGSHHVGASGPSGSLACDSAGPPPSTAPTLTPTLTGAVGG